MSLRFRGKYYGGNRRLLESKGISAPEYPALSQAGKTPLCFDTEDGVYLGAIAAAMSSVFVVSNALRLRFFKPRTVIEIKIEENQVKEDQVMEKVIKVNGMMCGHCKARVEQVCKAVPGATGAVADLEKKQVTVFGDAQESALKQAITNAGYEVVE